jgi:hypothetical protein
MIVGCGLCVLLPCVEGHGLSIKTIEALASGAPLIATSAARAVSPTRLLYDARCSAEAYETALAQLITAVLSRN